MSSDWIEIQPDVCNGRPVLRGSRGPADGQPILVRACGMMGFLLDENLPRVPSLQPRLPVTYALELGARPTDSELWTHAEQNDLAIVTKDADFSGRIVLG